MDLVSPALRAPAVPACSPSPLDAAWRRLERLPGARRVPTEAATAGRAITLQREPGAATVEVLAARVFEKHVLVCRHTEARASGAASAGRRVSLWLPLTPTVVRALLDEKRAPSDLLAGGRLGQPGEQLAQ